MVAKVSKIFHFRHNGALRIIPRDIVVDLFRMADIDQNEDLVMACVTDIRFDLSSLFLFSCNLNFHCKTTHIDRKAVDSDGDGEITKEEFVKNALKSRFLQKMLEN